MIKTSGEFKTKQKFIEFIGTKGNLNFISKEAIIEGSQLSGLGLDEMKFKLTIYEDSTVDLEDIEGQSTTLEFRKNLVDVILEKTISPFRKRMVITELSFTSVQPVGENPISLYLSVDYQKPIDKLASIFEDDNIEITDNQLDKLDDLLSIFDDDDYEDEVLEEKNEDSIDDKEKIDIFDVNKQIGDSFERMKKDKIEELKTNLLTKEKELSRLEIDKNLTETKIKQLNSDIELINSRLDYLEPIADSNGVYFNVSERLNEQVVLEDDIYNLIKSKVSKVKSINAEAFMKLFEQGEFQVRFAKFEEDNFVEIIDSKDFDEKITNILSKLNITVRDEKFYILEELGWAEIVNKFIKLGFLQSSEWDKICNSNSYSDNLDGVES